MKQNKLDDKELELSLKVLNEYQLESQKKLEKLSQDLITFKVILLFFT